MLSQNLLSCHWSNYISWQNNHNTITPSYDSVVDIYNVAHNFAKVAQYIMATNKSILLAVLNVLLLIQKLLQSLWARLPIVSNSVMLMTERDK